MELTNKVHYLVTEYAINIKPLITELTGYINTINGLQPLTAADFPNVTGEALAVLLSEINGDRSNIIAALKGRIKPLAESIADKATKLVVLRDNHITDMTANVDADADLAELKAQTESLKTAVQGVGLIPTGGSAAAALIAGQNAPTLIQLATKSSEKAQQVQQATEEIPQLVSAAAELANFVALIGSLN